MYFQGVGNDTVGKQMETHAAQPPPAAKKHPTAAITPKGPVAAPKGKPKELKEIFRSKEIDT